LKASTSKSAAARGVHAEQRQAALAQQRLEVHPRRVRALGERVVALVEDLVQDLQPLVGQTDLVGIGIDEKPRHPVGSPAGRDGAVLTPDVAGRLLHLGQEVRAVARARS
jgi:hypothetical protein